MLSFSYVFEREKNTNKGILINTKRSKSIVLPRLKEFQTKDLAILQEEFLGLFKGVDTNRGSSLLTRSRSKGFVRSKISRTEVFVIKITINICSIAQDRKAIKVG